MAKKLTFALAFCNRGFMPGELIYGARDDMVQAVTGAGFDYIMMDRDATRFGGIETRDEGLLYARWLKSHEGEYDGVIFSMPIFADENGAIAALRHGKSLLPVGVLAVEGRFERGAAIDCRNSAGQTIARGLINYTAGECRRIIRRPSADIASILGYMEAPELIHRDNMVLIA